MEFSGLNKSSNENLGNEMYSQSASSSSKPHCHSNNGFRSAENLLTTEGHKIKNEGVESGDGETTKTCQRLQTSISASHLGGSPVFTCSNLSPSLSTPSENKATVPTCYLNHDDALDESSQDKSCSCDFRSNSPLNKNSGMIIEDNDDKLSSSFTPSPNFWSSSKIHLASGESSDERVDRKEKSIAASSREGSFERSVSFQENNFLDAEKSSDHLQVSDSNRPLDLSRPIDASSPHSVSSTSTKEKDRDRKESKESKPGDKDKKSKKGSWYNVLNPTYKSRSEELKKLFKDLPSDERLIVDYSCALQKDILVHGRLYVTSNYFSFYSKIFGWETFLSIKCKDIVALTKEKTALVIPNALQINTETDKHFFTSFAARDKTYLMLFRIWQNALMDQQMSAPELWQWVHSSYGEELGLTSDDDDYVAPSTEDDMKVYGAVPPESIIEEGTTTSKVLKRNSIDSVEDLSQGESNLEDERLTGSNAFSPSSTQEDSRLDFKSSFSKSQKSSSPPPSPSPGLVSHYSSPSSPLENEIPTDLSDTVESEPDKDKIIGNVAELVVCPNIATHHLGREVTNAVYGLPIDTLFTLLFTNSKFMFDIYAGRKTYDVVISPWQSNPETNQKIRQVTYTLTLPTNSFGPKVSHVTETQVISAFSKPSEIYTIDAEASNSGIPYADSFYVSNHWCLTRESSTETRLILWSQVKYKKNVWGFMKNVIDKNAFSGMESLMSDLNCSLLREIDKTNLKRTKRRRRRAGSKGNDIGDPLHVPSPIISCSDTHKATQIPSRKMTLPSIVSVSKNSVGASSIKSVTLFFLCALLVVNGFLYYRLYSLEERVISNVSLKDYGLDAATLKFSGPNGDKILIEEWVQILRHQEVLHAEELERWRAVIMEAANYLQKAEESLRYLHSSIPSKQASKMQVLLSRLQRLQQKQEEQKQNSKPSSSSAEEPSPSPINTPTPSPTPSTFGNGEHPKDFKPSVEL